MKTAAPWLKSDLFPFRKSRDGEISFLRWTSVKEITWETLNRTQVVLSGRLPQAFDLLKFQTGDALEILKKDHGPYEIYYEDEVVFRIDGIEQRIWRIPDLMLLDPANDSELEMELTIVGGMFILGIQRT